MNAKVLAFAVLALAASPAQAQTAAELSELPPMELGHIQPFASAAEALTRCQGDVVVWADQDSGYFYPHWHPKFGATPHGVFTCLRDAMHADYWNINPFASNPERGREFPIDPSLLPPGV